MNNPLTRHNPLLTALVVILAVLCVAGCQSFDLEQSIGVGPEDNAVLRVEAHIDPAWSESTADYCRTEFPAGFDITTLTPQQLEAATGC